MLLSIALTAMSWMALGLLICQILQVPGIRPSAASTAVNLLSAYSTLSAAMAIIGAITGVGAVGSGIAATVLYLIKQRGKAAAALLISCLI